MTTREVIARFRFVFHVQFAPPLSPIGRGATIVGSLSDCATQVAQLVECNAADFYDQLIDEALPAFARVTGEPLPFVTSGHGMRVAIHGFVFVVQVVADSRTP